MFEEMPSAPSAKPSKVERFAESVFYEEKWDREAAVRAKRGVLKKILDRNSVKGPATPESKRAFAYAEEAQDFMRAEAIRDNEAFNKTRQTETTIEDGVEKKRIILDKLDAEYALWKEMLVPVTEHIKHARDNPETTPYRPLLLVLGGGLKGPYSAGGVLGLHYAGIPPRSFKQLVGISTGAPVITYYAGGLEQTALGSSLYYEECTTRDFINFARPWKIMDVERLTHDWMAQGAKQYNEEAVNNCGAELWYGVTRAIQREAAAEEEFVNGSTAQPSRLAAIRASASVPLVAGAVPPVNEIAYNDGAFDPLAIEKIIEQFDPTDILILPNIPFDRLDTFQTSKTERFVAELSHGLGAAGSLLSLAQVEKFMYIKEQMRKSMEIIQKERKVNVGFIWPPDTGLNSFKKDPDAMKSAIYGTARTTIDAFGAPQPHEIKLYETPGFQRS